MALSTGSLLADRYEITAPIATGGMGEVWKARDRVLSRVVAAKVLRSEYTGDPNFLARFRNEARHTAALTHPNIASVYDYGETVDETGHNQLAFLVMEFVEGQPLVTILHDEGALPVDWTLHVLSQSADGLSAAHRAGVVHRDIKPGNLMVRPDGVVKLTDFGIAQARDAAPLTRTGMVVGTAQYLSPEQAQGMEVTAASDVYSLGVVGYECLAGVRPFDGASQVAIALAHINRPPPPLPAHVPPAVRLLIERALAKDPADRFADGGAFAEAIRRVAAGGSLAAGSSPATAPSLAVGGAALGGAAMGTGMGTAMGTGIGRGLSPGTAALSNGCSVFLGASPGDAGAGAGGTGGGAAAAPPTGPAGPMPPLQAPDEEYWGPEDDGPPPDSRRRWMWIAIAAVVLLLLAGGTWFLLADPTGSAGDAGRTTATTAQTSASGVTIDVAAYVGRDADEVQSELEGKGLQVTQSDASDATVAEGAGIAGRDLEAGQVADISPDGLVPPTATVTLYVVPEAQSGGDDEPTSEAPTTTSEAPTTTSEAPTTTSEAPTTTSEAPTTTDTTTAGGSSAPPTDPPPSDPPPTDQPVDTNAGAAAPNGAG
jgi:serine/threonine-protein kinase